MSTEGTATEFCLIVPCFDEEDAIRETIDSLTSVLGSAGPHEILVVDDGSTDRTPQILAELAERHPTVRVVRHEANLGYGAALKTGIRRTNAPLIAITDADGTYPHDRMPELLALGREADMVVGARTLAGQGHSTLRRIPKSILRAYCAWLSGQSVPDMNSGLRVFGRPLAERYLALLPNGFSFTTTLTLALLTNHHDVRFVPIEYAPRVGRSKIRPVRDTLGFLQLIVRTGMYFAPLRVLGPPAGVLLLGFLVSLVYDSFVLRNLTEKTLLLFLFGAQTLVLALIADMIDKRQGR